MLATQKRVLAAERDGGGRVVTIEGREPTARAQYLDWLTVRRAIMAELPGVPSAQFHRTRHATPEQNGRQ